MMLCGDPRNLLWLRGEPPPPKGTLARRLLEDLALGRRTTKGVEYRLQQHLKVSLPDEQLRAYYDARLQEASEDLPDGPSSLGPSGGGSSSIPGGPQGVLEELEIALGGPGGPRPPEPLGVEEVREHPLARLRTQGGPLWAPVGWMGSRTLSHGGDGRSAGDEYGHLLPAGELTAWRSQYQQKPFDAKEEEGGMKDEEGGGLAPMKPEVKGLTSGFDEVSGHPEKEVDWRDSLRVHFREPMRCEVRDRIVRVSCRIRLLPGVASNLRDLRLLVQVLSPRHVVLLPGGGNTAVVALEKHLKNTKQPPGCPTPEIHSVGKPGGSTPISLALPSRKRRIQLSAECSERLRFARVAEGKKVARLRATSVEGGGLETAELAEGSPLPRGALLLGNLNLSGIRESLHRAGHSTDFSGPDQVLWSSCSLSLGTGVALGWRDTAPGTDQSMLLLEGAPCDRFFQARTALYKQCMLV